LRAPENTLPAAVAISVAVVSLLLRLHPNPIEPLVTFPNLHQSLPDHLWLSSSPSFAGNLAAAEVPRVPRPPAITGPFPGRVTSTDRTLVSPIELPAGLFVSPGPTSPPASTPTTVGALLGGPRAYL
jgi:hypothetical protein